MRAVEVGGSNTTTAVEADPGRLAVVLGPCGGAIALTASEAGDFGRGAGLVLGVAVAVLVLLVTFHLMFVTGP